MMEMDTPIPPQEHFICDACGHLKKWDELATEVIAKWPEPRKTGIFCKDCRNDAP